MLLAALNKMLRRTLSLGLNCDGRVETNLLGKREVNREVQESINGRTEEFQSSTIPKRNETKIPDPWFN